MPTTPSRSSMARAAVVTLAMSFAALCQAANPPEVDSLIAKGVRIKIEKDGVASEVLVGLKATITVEDYKLIGALHTLKRADISPETAPLDDNTAKFLSQLDQLEKFYANGAELTDDGFRAFAGWKSLKSFTLEHTGWNGPGHVRLTGMGGPGRAHQASSPNREQVRFGGCRVDNRVTEALARIKSLQSVDLGHTMVTDEGIAALQALPKLRIVRLSPQFSPRITDASLHFLGTIKTLEEIEIDQTWLTYEKGFSHLRELASLKKLVLTKVIASVEDIAKLKADHPTMEVQWTPPDDATTSTTKEQFQKFWAQPTKAKP